jgi:hypothetical protein
MNSNNQANSEYTMDEFGRDTRLRKTRVEEAKDFSEEIAERFKGKSWAEVIWELEEEEEREKEAEASMNIIQDYWRKIHWLNDQYELEEGEVFE